jgi:hypothetical protein
MNIKAFARAGGEFDSSGDWVSAGRQDGMTLRDYFAAKAMQAFISAYPCQGIDNEDGGISIDLASIADDAYAMADEMLQARSK